jgi:hypothetical protein
MIRRSAFWGWRGLAVAALALAAAVASPALDGFADRQIRRRHDAWAREADADRMRAASYRRPVTFGPSLDQNAADWYRRALTRSREPTASQLGQLAALRDRGPGQAASIPDDIEAVCPAAEGIADVSQALRCTQCDWHLDYDMGPSTLFDAGTRAIALADCLTLRGHRAAGAQSYGAATESYLQAIAFGCDLGTGNLIMNIVGIGAAKSGLMALSRLLTTIDYDPMLFAAVADRLTKLQPCLPTVQNGVQIERLQATNALIAEAMRSVRADKRIVNPLLPRHSVAARRLAQDLALVNDLAQSATIADPQERARFVADLRRRSMSASNSFVKEEVAANWFGAIDAAYELVRDSHAVLAIIDIERWHQRHGKYPDSRAEVPSLINENRVRYERDPDWRGYSLLGTSAAGLSQRLAHRSADRRPPVVR